MAIFRFSSNSVLLEVGELEARLAVLELALGSARDTRAPDPSVGGLLSG